MSARPSIWLFVAVAAAIASLAFVMGQGYAGAGVLAIILLSTIWTITAQQRWGKNNG